jgi:two-component system, OmpR family, sensor histidine kinase TrcS
MSPVGDARGWRAWTLRRQLVFGVSAVVITVLLVVGTLSVLTLRKSLNDVITAQLAVAANGFSYSATKFRSTPTRDGALPPPGSMKPLTQLIGQAPGNVAVLVQNGKVVDSALFMDGEARSAPAEAIDKIAAMSWPNSGPRTVELPGLGDYLIDSRPGDPGEYFINGVSLRPTQHAVARETVVVIAMTSIALLATAIGTMLMVRFALLPLSRVADTAAEVATLPLDREHYAITPRVAAKDTDPRTEVGLVGDTLNRLLANVERALADVAASDRRMRQFITDASHELRTPLAAIQGYAELTRQDSSVLPETTEYSLARIEAEALRMNSLVADLLLLARLDEGEDVETADVDLADVVADAVNDATVSAPTHRWLTHVPDEIVWVPADRAKLHQLVANLLSNARVHTPAGTTVTTGIAAVRADDGTAFAELTVTDDGPGIAPDVVPHLFERFVRADKSRASEGGSFGLGLSIVSSIVEAHRGSIEVQSNSGRTTFRVRLPGTEQRLSPGAGAPSNAAAVRRRDIP